MNPAISAPTRDELEKSTKAGAEHRHVGRLTHRRRHLPPLPEESNYGIDEFVVDMATNDFRKIRENVARCFLPENVGATLEWLSSIGVQEAVGSVPRRHHARV